MATNKQKHSLSSETYTLTDLFGGGITLVIPDMQRDYCWGTTIDPTLPQRFPFAIDQASAFVQGIVYLYATERPYILGLLYGYENPQHSCHLHIIDGQQRLTTLYLLLGMLYRRTPTDELRHLLISDYALIDDREPKLIYQARREALYFMSDLVTRFFLNRDGRLSQLERSDWFYPDYGSDPTVQSFINAIRLIDIVLEEAADRFDSWNWDDFAHFVAHDLQFLYCDLGIRTDAEAMFLTINTTGQPLTFSQNMRALSIAWEPNIADSNERWNEMEDWFWRNRSRHNLDDFLAFYLASLDTPKAFSLEGLWQYFRAWVRLCDSVGGLNSSYTVPINIELGFAVQPCIDYVLKFGEEATNRDVARLWQLLSNLSRYQKPGKDDTSMARDMVAKMTRPDLLSLLHTKHVPNKIINEEERNKLQFIEANPEHREIIEDILERAQAHPLLNGRAARLIVWSCGKEGNEEGKHPALILQRYVDAIYDLWGMDIDKQPKLDPLRRALLSIRHQEYPIVRRGDSMLTLCWYDFDWQRLMLSAPGLIRQLIDRCHNFSEGADQAFGQCIERFNDKSYPYWFIVKRQHLLDNCRKRQIYRPCPPFLGFYDYEMNVMRWFVEQQEIEVDPMLWRPMMAYGARCLYTDHLVFNLAVDLYYQPNEKKRYRIEIFSREEDNPKDRKNKERINLRDIVEDLEGNFYFDKRRKRYCISVHNPIPLLRQLLK